MQKVSVLAAAFAVAIAALQAAPAAAKPPQRESASIADIVFSEIEKRLIREYYAAHGHAADNLPPGIRKKLARGKPLPPGIAKRFLPGELESQLPAHAGTVRRVVGNDVVLVAAATGVILDILFDVIKH
ncbi:MAG TPA: anti-virulence regulator CigR family protein [Alphaproteobacteria bacterium]|nr:anti-virulence regulator CigR family protein [Alphaproteobacteria bacterium]